MKNEPKVKEASEREVEFMAEVIESSQVKKKRREGEVEGGLGREQTDEEAARMTKFLASAPVVVEGVRSPEVEDRGSKRKKEDAGKDVEYDEEGSRINLVGAPMNIEVGFR